MAFGTMEIVDLVLLGMLMLGLGCAIEYEQFKSKFQSPKGIMIGLTTQFIVMPALAYGIAKWLLTDSPLLQVALILVACSPGGALSNILSWIVGADLPLSVAMTTCSSIAAIGMLPLNIYIYIEVTGLGRSVAIDYGGIILSVFVIILGSCSGIYIRTRSLLWAVRFGKIGAIAAVALVLASFVKNSQSNTPIWEQTSSTYLATALVSLFGLMLGLGFSLLAHLPKPSCVAVSIETSIQNKVIALAIIGITFETQAARDEASAVPLCYALFATLINVIWVVVAWKLGWTSYDSKLSLCALFNVAKSDLETEEAAQEENASRESEILEAGLAGAGKAEAGKGSSKDENTGEDQPVVCVRA